MKKNWAKSGQKTPVIQPNNDMGQPNAKHLVSRSAEFNKMIEKLNGVLMSASHRFHKERMNAWLDEAEESIQMFRKLNNGS